MKRVWVIGALSLLVATAGIHAQQGRTPLVVTSSNSAQNELLVYDAAGTLRQHLSTQGQGGVSGNAGGIAVQDAMVAVVNFGSASVSLFTRGADGLALTQVITAVSAPVSVAFGRNHLYVLGTTTVESHQLATGGASPAPDGVAALLHADGSAAQVGIAGDQLIVAEKSNAVEVVGLQGGAVAGGATAVPLPAGSDTPFGLVTRGENAYVTIAHSDEVSLIKQGQVIAITTTGTPGGGGQHSPCWLAIAGPYLFSANSPSHSLSRFVATGTQIIPDEAVAAATAGAPTDLAAASQLLAGIDAGSNGGRLTQWTIDGTGALTTAAVSTIPSTANGVGIVQ